MTNVKLRAFFAYGVMLAVLFGACADPVSVTKEGAAPSAAAGRDSTDMQPVEVEIAVYRGEAAAGGADARAAAGVGKDEIKTDPFNNFTQLIVMDRDTGKIIKLSENQQSYGLFIPPLDEVHYNFLMLKGYKGESGAPTLLRAGYQERTIRPADGAFTFKILLWPLLVDTEFVTADENIPEAQRKKDPLIGGLFGQALELPAVKWTLNWKIGTVGITGNSENGLIQLMNANQSSSSPFFLKARGIINSEKDGRSTTTINYPLTGGGLPENMTVDPDTAKITLDIVGKKETVPKIDMTGSANFNLEYVPFSMAGADDWTGFTSAAASAEGLPVWIIRNGLNDEVQDSSTNFIYFGPTNPSGNGNGAVRFTVKANKPNPAGTSPLTITEGFRVTTADGTSRAVFYTSGGYAGDADLYYTSGDKDDYSSYAFLGTYTGPASLQQIPLAGSKYDEVFTNEKDVHIILIKGGEISNPQKLEWAAYGTIVENH
jgi:hypothetical protein